MNSTATITPWKITNEAVPRSAAQIFCIDRNGRILIIHRSDKVRSVKNAWSFPSGLHDVGERLVVCAARELHEEFNLTVRPECMLLVDAYDNIAGDPLATEQWHWNVHVIVCITSYEHFENMEPDKHDEVRFVPMAAFRECVEQLNFHASFKEWFRRDGGKLMKQFRLLIDAAE